MGAAPSDELEHIWSLVRSQLALVVEEPTFRLWLEPLRAVEISEERIVVEAPRNACGWVVVCCSSDTAPST